MTRTRILNTFLRVAGASTIRPPFLAHMQTDGSYHVHNRLSRTAAILRTAEEGEVWKSIRTYIGGEHAHSTESEWASVLDGLELAARHDEGAVELENDNQSVVQTLMGLQAPRGIAKEYCGLIWSIAMPMDWLAVRWIPREANRADRLFRVDRPAATRAAAPKLIRAAPPGPAQPPV